MEQAQEAAAEAIAQRRAGLRLKVQGGVIHAQFFKRVAERRIIGPVSGVDAAVHHGRYGLVAGQRLKGGIVGIRDGIAHLGIADCLDGSRHIAHVARQQRVLLHVAGAANAHFDHFKHCAGLHHAHAHARFQHAVDHANKTDGSAVVVIYRVKHKRLQRLFLTPFGRRHMVDDRLQHLADADAHFGRHPGRMGCIQADHLLDLLAGLIRLRRGQVDLVDHRDGLQVMLQRQVHIGQGLRFNSLGGIHHQQGPLTGSQSAADFVSKVHMAGGVDQVQRVFLAVFGLIAHGDSLGFDGDAALALQLHRVHDLGHHLPLLVYPRHFQNAVSQRGLAMIDMGYDAEIPDPLQAVVHGSPSSTDCLSSQCFCIRSLSRLMLPQPMVSTRSPSRPCRKSQCSVSSNVGVR